MGRVINMRLLAHPLNWGIVWTVLLLASVAISEFHRGFGGCACNDIPD